MKSQWRRRHICWNELMEPKWMKHTWGKRQCQALKITIRQIIQTCIQQWFPLDFHLFSSYLVFILTSVCAVVNTGCKPAGRQVLPMPMLFFLVLHFYFPPQTKDIQVRLTGNSKLSLRVDVSSDGLSLYVSVLMTLATCPGFTPLQCQLRTVPVLPPPHPKHPNTKPFTGSLKYVLGQGLYRYSIVYPETPVYSHTHRTGLTLLDFVCIFVLL